MAFAEKFEDLEIWREARRLNTLIFLGTTGLREFWLRDQFRRAALSVMNNISEGFERRTSKDFSHFLDMAKGSAGEVRSMTYAAEDIRLLPSDKAIALREDYETLSKRIASFQRHLK